MSYEKELKLAIEATLEAGELLRTEFHRWGGPRGEKAHAEADEIAEWEIRKRFLQDFPQYQYRGEETGSVHAENSHVWLVDPNDGTSSYLRGVRGSAVSIGLVREGIPVLGVVYAFCAPDDRGDLIAWAEGCEFTRNGSALTMKWDVSNKKHLVLLLSSHREQMIPSVLKCTQPYRYRAFTSIAYRLALVAAGDGVAAVSWHEPGDWDYAGGHALIRAAGGIFLNEKGEEIQYARNGASKVKMCFGGEPQIVNDLWQRNWASVQKQQFAKTEAPSSLFVFARLKPGIAVKDSQLLSRAQGCLLGQVAGDALGQMVEFQDAESVRRKYPNGIRKMEDGGSWNTIAGQPTDDSELALLLARSIVEAGGYQEEKAAEAYYYWIHTNPFDVGTTTRQAMIAVSSQDVAGSAAAEAMSSHASQTSQANGSLMRISSLGIHGYKKSEGDLWRMSASESSLTHPHLVCQQCCGLFAIAIAYAIRTGSAPEQIYKHVMSVSSQADLAVRKALQDAASEPPDYHTYAGWVLVAFQNAFYQLLHTSNFEEALIQTVMQGGDSDTNGAIAGALLGAVYGRDLVPFEWRQMVLSCRPHSVAKVQHPRPYDLWPVDILNLAELLLLCG